ELLVVDDQGSGAKMACRCGVKFAAAGWAYEIPEIRDSMRESSDYYFASEEALERFLFGGSRV
ncbi:MAG TPA: hydrolase, partial [Oscillospiraceae bacterium]|nr:hydrolase [Oscillospiraceae bacterium]